jgi:hypothetical protein
MDAGSGINLIYARTLKAMNISLSLIVCHEAPIIHCGKLNSTFASDTTTIFGEKN